jgi:hypothetical protein
MNWEHNWMLTKKKKKTACELNYLALYQLILEIFNEVFQTLPSCEALNGEF